MHKRPRHSYVFLGGGETKATADPSLFSVGTAILAIHTMSSLIVAMTPLLFPILFATRRLYRAKQIVNKEPYDENI